MQFWKHSCKKLYVKASFHGLSVKFSKLYQNEVTSRYLFLHFSPLKEDRIMLHRNLLVAFFLSDIQEIIQAQDMSIVS